MAGQLGGIDPLLDGFFGFLRRKTDFFTGAVSPEAAQASVLAAFTKNMERSQEDARERAAKEKKRKADEEARRERLQAEKAKQQKGEEEESRIVDVTDEVAASSSSAPAAAAPAAAENGAEEGEKEGEEGQQESKGQAPINNGGTCDTYRWGKQAPQGVGGLWGSLGVEVVGQGQLAISLVHSPRSTRISNKHCPTDAPCRAVCRWEQSLQDLAVFVPIPAGTKAKLLDVKIGKKSLRVAVAGQPAPLIDGDLSQVRTPALIFWL